MLLVEFHSTEPAKVRMAIATLHMIASAILLDWGVAFRAVPDVIFDHSIFQSPSNHFTASFPNMGRKPTLGADFLAAFAC